MLISQGEIVPKFISSTKEIGQVIFEWIYPIFYQDWYNKNIVEWFSLQLIVDVQTKNIFFNEAVRN